MWFYLAFIGILGILRVVELAVSKRNWRSHQDYAEQLKEPIFAWMVTLHASMFLLLPLELFWRRPDFGGPVTWFGIVMTVIALCLRFWTLKTIGKSWNVRVIYARDYPIVASGPYRFIRHPNYLVVIVELAFVPLIYNLYWSALFLTVGNALILSKRIPTEEKVLFENPEWVEKMSGKPRFFPFF
jgi:methyltransferase